MSLRIFSPLALAAALGACGGDVSAPPQGDTVDCAIGPGAEFAEVCTLEVVADDEFIIHHPDGGFRRFVWTDNGLLASADGADSIISQTIDGEAGVREFSLEIDRYRMPATLMSPPGP